MVKQTSEQLAASNPKSSVWVGASAGTGKTFVLSNRVLRLMLAGSRPDKILCLTYTKTAAAEMAIRVNSRLSSWVTMQDGELSIELENILGHRPEGAQVLLARKLFAKVLDVPGGLKFQTIHSFCQSLLGRFPLEADISPNFDLLDDITIHQELGISQDELLIEIADGENDELGQALEQISSMLAEETFTSLMRSLAFERSEIEKMIAQNGSSFKNMIDAIREILELDKNDSLESFLETACDEKTFDSEQLSKIAEVLLQTSSRYIKNGEKIRNWIECVDSRVDNFDIYKTAYLKANGEIKSDDFLISKATIKKYPELYECILTEAERVKKVSDRLLVANIFENTRNVLRVGYELIRHYNKRKSAHNVVDYDDLIAKASELVNKGNVGWILYKLDEGIDHILIDEAQDTNPIQWDIIRKISDEFFSGIGTRDTEDTLPRTIFAVGDIKQSIYSFQKAEPKKFDDNKNYFIRQAQSAELSFAEVPMNLSFRSTAAVLEVVDKVFAPEDYRQAVSFSSAEINHATHRVNEPGLVEIWETVKTEKKETDEEWSPPVIQKPSQAPKRILAEKIAAQIKEWTERGEILASKGRAVRPSDVLILVRRRDEFVQFMINALKRHEIPVAGLDRMTLTKELAVMDLMAVAKFTLLPSDDLTLAVVLKSPFIGFDEDDLLDLAHNRNRNQSLWQALLKRKNEKSAFAEAADYLKKLTDYADFYPPFEFFSYLLCSLEGREKLISRLGEQINDPVDEFLNQAMKYEQNNISSMQGFLSWIEKGEIQIKREMEQAGNMVRIMTVHAAKGLQAPIVFLPDTCGVPDMSRETLLWHDDPEKRQKALILKQPKDKMTGVALAAYERREQDLKDEYKRLLYVAMTRAEERLYVTGFEGERGRKADCWYDMILNAISSMDGVDELTVNDESILRLEHKFEIPVRHEDECEGEADLVIPLPSWVDRHPMPEPIPSRPLSPSSPDEDEISVSPLEAAKHLKRDKQKYHRGRIIHKLLELLPDLDKDRRAGAARQYLSQPAHELEDKDIDQITTDVMSILTKPEYEELFGDKSRAEVPIVGQIGSYTLSGQVDRLAVLDNEVLIVDYKTNRPPPKDVSKIPQIYVKQMAAYRAVLSEIYPDHKIRTSLLWTDIGRLMEVPNEMMDKVSF